MRRCPHCGQLHPANALFCPVTGRPLTRRPARGVLAILTIAIVSMAVIGAGAWYAANRQALAPEAASTQRIAPSPSIVPSPFGTVTPASTDEQPTDTRASTAAVSTTYSIPTGIVGARWWAPTESFSVEFFDDGVFVYNIFPENVGGQGGLAGRGTYTMVGSNRMRIDDGNVFSTSAMLFDVSIVGSALHLGDLMLYQLDADFSRLPVEDDRDYHSLYFGYWENEDSATRSIPAIHIYSDEDGNLQAHVWGACSPTWCDWGHARASTTHRFLYIFWDHGFARTHMTLSLRESSVLEARLLTHFTDGSGRSDYSSQDRFYFVLNPTVTPPSPF